MKINCNFLVGSGGGGGGQKKNVLCGSMDIFWNCTLYITAVPPKCLTDVDEVVKYLTANF